jgi:hypothetical protein
MHRMPLHRDLSLADDSSPQEAPLLSARKFLYLRRLELENTSGIGPWSSIPVNMELMYVSIRLSAPHSRACCSEIGTGRPELAP